MESGPKSYSGAALVGKSNRKHRWLATYQGAQVGLLWFSVGSDGSFYFGPYTPTGWKTVLGYANHPIGPQGNRVIGYKNFKFRDATDLENPSKTSVHASGKVHRGHLSHKTFPLRGITSQQDIAIVVFPHASTLPVIPSDQLRPTDLVVEFPLSPLNPAACLIAVAPYESVKVLINQHAVQQVNKFVVYQNLRNLPELWFQFHFSDSPRGKPPRGTIISMAMTDEE